MSENKWTPGPWRVWEADAQHWWVCETADRMRHEHFAQVDVGGWWGEEGRANARLIAAAPELAKALEGLVNTFASCGGCAAAENGEAGPAGCQWHGRTRINARAALRRARGETEAVKEKSDG